MSDSSHTLLHDAVDVLCRELTAQWQSGDCQPAERFLERLGESPSSEDAVRLIYEEVCLRQDRGEEVSLAELEDRFPAWSQELSVLIDCHRLFRQRSVAPQFPTVGETLGDFRLVSELGRGALGVVYLARQQTLSDRPVVLKLSPRKTREHLSLARLQHTHIIPLHALYEFPGRNLIAMCQPWLGGTTLETILRKLQAILLANRTGQSILDVIDAEEKIAHTGASTPSGFRRLLARCSYSEAICLLGACLADGLQYAHDQDLVHLDIKPSNVLMTADAQPMLLDFHLAIQPLAAGAVPPDWFGGTPAYLSPEHRVACEAARHGRPIPEALGPAADIFSLGKLLYVALGGNELHEGKVPTPLYRLHPQVDIGLSDIIQKCMQPEQQHRYESAKALAADLRRHIAHHPLQGVPNRSWKERWRKWKQRRPQAVLVLGLLFALIAGAVVMVAMMIERVSSARADLQRGSEQLQQGLHREALYTLSQGRERLFGLPGCSELRAELDQSVARTRRAAAAANLHRLTEKLRYHVEKQGLTDGDFQQLDLQCRNIWNQRELIAGTLHDGTTDVVRHDLLDFVVLWIELQRPQVGNAVTLQLLDQAERFLGSSATLERERQWLQGKPDDMSAIQKSNSPWEQVIWGRSFLRSEQFDKAAQLFQKAVDSTPNDFWPNYYLGICAYQQQDYQAALRWFSVAVALAPGSAECYYNRGLTLIALDQKEQAIREYDKALRCRPDFGAASLNRGHIYYLQKQYSQALGDFEHALEHGANKALAHYNLAICQLAMQNEAEALKHLRLALEFKPGYAEAQQLLAQLHQKTSVQLK